MTSNADYGIPVTITDTALLCFAQLCRDVPSNLIMDRDWLRRAFDSYAAMPPFEVSPNDGSAS